VLFCGLPVACPPLCPEDGELEPCDDEDEDEEDDDDDEDEEDEDELPVTP
jgi:hypothetical protein